MKIKSLLIGSAAALVAATGAKAADAVVIAEPEPVEYVRVCDAYGAGFFYIPGTETCLRISGYVWFQMWTSSDQISGAPFDTTAFYGGTDRLGNSALRTGARGRVNFDARSDTEWGTLRSYIRLQGSWSAIAPVSGPDGLLTRAGVTNGVTSGITGADGPAVVDHAYIELGGLRMGYTESAWAQTQGGGASNWGAHSWGGMYYGYQQRNLVAYTFQGGNGFFGTLSLEDDGTAGDEFAPDVVVKIGVNQGWGSIWAKIGYDDERLAVSSPTAPPSIVGLLGDGWGAAIGAQINVPNSPGSSLRIIGYYADSSNAYNVGGPGIAGGTIPVLGFPAPGRIAIIGGYEYSILASYEHAFSSTLSASVAFQYFNDSYYGFTYTKSGFDAWGAELSVVWFPVTNFEIRAEIHYDDVGSSYHRNFPGVNPDGVASGFIRFTRYF